MKYISIFKIIAFTSYLFIFFNGWMISMPMFFYLPASAFDFSEPPQAISSILAIIGFIITLLLFFSSTSKKYLFWYVLVFLLLLCPLIQRLTSVPIGLFNYPLFIIPVSVFLISYLLFLLSILKSKNNRFFNDPPSYQTNT